MSRAEDIAALRLLDAIYQERLPASVIRERFGLSNGALQGAKKRDRDGALPCLCRRPENQDGGMPVRWWAQ